MQTPALAPVPCQNITRSPQGGPHRSHTQRLPAAHVHDGDEIDPRYHAMGRPVMAPVMDREILYPRMLAGGGVLVLDRVAAGVLALRVS